MLERMPIVSPPTIAPQNDPIPPTMTMTNVRMIQLDARRGLDRVDRGRQGAGQPRHERAEPEDER